MFNRDHAANQFGAMGVDVFFVISGFVITRTAKANPHDFLKNRAIRILPLYYAWVAPFLITCLLHHDLPVRVLISSLTLWPALDTYVPPALMPGWSLCFEMLFYVSVWSVIRGAKAWMLILGYATAMVLGALTGWTVFCYLGAPLILEFLAGVALASVTTTRPLAGGIALAFGAMSVAAFATFGSLGLDTHLILERGALWRPMLWGLPAVAIVYGTMQLEPWLKGAWTRPLVFLGDASYSLYLSHLLLVIVIVALAPATPSWVVTAICVVFGAGTYLGLERPLGRVVRSLFPGTTPGGAQAVVELQ